MIWVKSILVGLLAVIVTLPVGFAILTAALNAKSSSPVQVDIVTFTKATIVQLLMIRYLFSAFFGSIFGSSRSERGLAPRQASA